MAEPFVVARIMAGLARQVSGAILVVSGNPSNEDLQLEPHPSQQLLRQFALGLLDEQAASRLELHLESCVECGQTFDSFVLDADQLVSRLRNAADNAASMNQGPPGSRETITFGKLGQADTSNFPQADAARHRADSAASRVGAASIGQTISGFRLLSLLGEGGFGAVFRAEDSQLQRKVALKVLRSAALARPGAQEMFLAEARALAAIHHDNVVPIFQAGSDNGQFFIAMPLLGGETLAAKIERQGALPAAEVRRIGCEVAAGLAAIHAKGLVHRDLKPGNIWLEAGSERAKVLDLGLAHDLLSPIHYIGGSPPYMSPEQTKAQPLDFRSDLFSLGAVLYECATGRRAFAGANSSAEMSSVREHTPPAPHVANPGIQPDLSALILDLLQKQPNDRPSSASAVAARLSAPTGPSLPERPRQWGYLLVGGLIAILAIGIVAPYFLPSPSTAETAQHELRRTNKNAALPAPLSIRALDVHHYASVDKRNVEGRGILGKQSFKPSLGDEITVTGILSAPAYSYLVIFRPDGQEELLYPQDEAEIPQLTNTPLYPEKRRDHRYYLEEGAGLWIVALISSETALPSYRDWKKTHGPAPRQPAQGKSSQGKSGHVLCDDGARVSQFSEQGGTLRGQRQAEELSPIVQLTNWLRKESHGTVMAIAFTVEKGAE